MNRAIDFFEQQFRGTASGGTAALNPFEDLALPFLQGDVLDLGAGLGQLSMAAAARGARVTAYEASPTAVSHLRRQALAQGRALEVVEAALCAQFRPPGEYDAVVAIGLLMFFAKDDAYALLRCMQGAVRPGGVLVVNVLVAGTTWTEPLDPGAHHLFDPDELLRALAPWAVEVQERHAFPAPGATEKRFVTLVARRPGAG